MIAFYAWTDTLLLNALRIKTTSYQQEKADLFILALPRVTPALVEEIRRCGVFQNVVIIEEPGDNLPRSLHKAVKLFSGRRYYKQFSKCLKRMAENRYRLLFTGGFWSYTLFLYAYLSQFEPNMELAFYEEGIGSYSGGEMLFWCDPLSEKRSRLMRQLFYRSIYHRAVAMTKSLYLFCPEACLDGGHLLLHRIEKDSEPVREVMSKLTKEIDVSPYIQRDVIFFLQPESNAEMKQTQTYIDLVVSVFGAEHVIIKPHPDGNDVLAQMDVPRGVYIEDSKMSFEHMLQNADWNRKLLITKGTSCVFYPRYMLEQRPAVVFLYGLYPKTRLKPLIGSLAERLRELCGDTGEVAIPTSVLELKRVLVTWSRRNI